MNYLDQLRLSKDKASVAFQEFALSTRIFNDYFFCFFEGKDSPYYVPRINPFVEKIKPINCGGKEKVLRVYELINNQEVYSKYKKAFFIDRDFNNPIENIDGLIFETPCYSIENLYVNTETFKKILLHELQLSETTDKSFEVCISLFNDRLTEFNNSTKLFNSWYACLIEIRDNQGIQTGVNLDDKLPKGFVNITLQSVTKNYNFDKIKQTFPNANEISEHHLEEKNNYFENCDANNIFRGKYQLEFLISIIQLIVDDSKTNKTINSSKINFSFDGALNHPRALNVFSAYAETPNILVEFLQRVTA